MPEGSKAQIDKKGYLCFVSVYDTFKLDVIYWHCFWTSMFNPRLSFWDIIGNKRTVSVSMHK